MFGVMTFDPSSNGRFWPSYETACARVYPWMPGDGQIHVFPIQKNRWLPKTLNFPIQKCQRSEIQLIFEATKMEDVPRTDLSWSHQQLGLVIQSIPSQHVATRLSWSKLLLRLSNRGCKHPYHFQNWEDPDPRWTSKKTSPIRHERLWTYHLWWRFWPGCLEKSAFVSIDSYISVYATYALLQLDR